MILDTGSDRCWAKPSLAAEVGIDLSIGFQEIPTTGIGNITTQTILCPVKLEVPQLGMTFEKIFIQFGLLPSGTNGLLGNAGFLAKFKTCFFKNDWFEIEPA
jgi:hypothetical protein